MPVSVPIFILGHVQLISQIVCRRDPEPVPLNCFYFETSFNLVKAELKEMHAHEKEALVCGIIEILSRIQSSSASF